MTKHQPSPKIGDSNIDEWEAEWVALKGGLRQRHHELDGLLGLYRLTLNGQDVAIGTGIDIRQGIPKRLYDFHRPSPSGRNHHCGQLIHQHRDQLEVQVLITGTDRDAQRIARQLKAVMLERHKPAWNVPVAVRAKTAAKPRRQARTHPRKPTPYPVPVAASKVSRPAQAVGSLP